MAKITQPRQTLCQCKGCRINLRLAPINETLEGILARQADLRRACENQDVAALTTLIALDRAAHETIARYQAEIEQIQAEPGGGCPPAEEAR